MLWPGQGHVRSVAVTKHFLQARVLPEQHPSAPVKPCHVRQRPLVVGKHTHKDDRLLVFKLVVNTNSTEAYKVHNIFH